MKTDAPATADPTWLRGDWMQTYTGKRFYPLDPRAEDIDIRDIAHSLSLLCRYAGHVNRFYSVAEHCILMSQAVSPENALAALLHDATEAYVVDVPRPLKLHLPDYRRIERQVWLAICGAFDLDIDLPHEVHQADTRILLNETAVLMPRIDGWGDVELMEPLRVNVIGLLPVRIERLYLERFDDLTRLDSLGGTE